MYESQDDCPVARTLGMIGDRWTILILRDLFRGYRRYNDLLRSLDGISPNLLADRLKRLEKHGIVERELYCERPPRGEYRLTWRGRRLAPVLEAMRQWGEAFADLAFDGPAPLAAPLATPATGAGALASG